MNELRVKCLLYADDHVIFSSSAKELQEMVTIMNKALMENGMKVNVTKTKVLVFERDERMTKCKVLLTMRKWSK
jgi:hypothetical protein